MDDEGTDAHFLIPTSWLSLVGLDDPSRSKSRSFARFIATWRNFAADHPDRLKGPIIASDARRR